MWALIILSCAYGESACDKITTIYDTQAQCGSASEYVQRAVEEYKPKGIVIYRCEEITASRSADASAEAATAGTLPGRYPSAA